MIYVNSEGNEVETSTMNKGHLVNALEKAMKERFLFGEGTAERTRAIQNFESLKEEILIRLK